MVTSSPYLPYLIRDVVSKVNEVFSNRLTDPFNVYFDYGLLADVTKNIYKKGNQGVQQANIYPLVWLVSNSINIKRGIANDVFGTTTFDLILAMPTSKDYTSQERTNAVFLPRLYPIYDTLLQVFQNISSFNNNDYIVHDLKERSYWGGSESGQSDAKNLFGNYIDALHVQGMKLNIEHPKTAMMKKRIALT